MWFAAEANSSVVVVLIKPLGTRKTARLEVLVKFKFQSKTLKFLEKNRVTPQISNNMPQICGFFGRHLGPSTWAESPSLGSPHHHTLRGGGTNDLAVAVIG